MSRKCVRVAEGCAYWVEHDVGSMRAPIDGGE